ncbi:MAG: hypothetical protein ABSA32_11070 [Candidatus Acidiferrales bacterium]|jgi:hypothetical protein
MRKINRARFAGILAVMLLAAVVRADDAPANVAGAWQFTADSSQGTFTATLTIQQDGGTIKGTQKSDFGDATITGTVKGNTIQFTVTVSGPNGSFTVDHDGTVTGDTMKGTFKMGGDTGNSGSWSATRQAQTQK